jgi:hypothetical protein
VARSRHKNGVERNRGADPYGILIQPGPLDEKICAAPRGEATGIEGVKRRRSRVEGVVPAAEARCGSQSPGRVPQTWTHWGHGARGPGIHGHTEASKGEYTGDAGAHGGPRWGRGSRPIRTSRPWPQDGQVCPAWRSGLQASVGGLSHVGAGGSASGAWPASQSWSWCRRDRWDGLHNP